MTRTSVEKLVDALRPRCARASRSETSKILDEFVAITGSRRKAAIRRSHGIGRKSCRRRGRPPADTADSRSQHCDRCRGSLAASARSALPP